MLKDTCVEHLQFRCLRMEKETDNIVADCCPALIAKSRGCKGAEGNEACSNGSGDLLEDSVTHHARLYAASVHLRAGFGICGLHGVGSQPPERSAPAAEH